MRYEIKYTTATIDLQLLKSIVSNHPFGFYNCYPDRQINNVYFDDPELHAFYQNVNGDPDRSKLRYRWYGTKSSFSSGQIELKRKQNNLGWKEYINWSAKNISDIEYNPIPFQLLEKLPLIKNFCADRPTLYNSYLRSYYVSNDEKFRITLDRNIHYQKNINNDYIKKESNLIIELKFEAVHSALSKEIQDHFPFRQVKYSKYCNGVSSLYL